MSLLTVSARDGVGGCCGAMAGGRPFEGGGAARVSSAKGSRSALGGGDLGTVGSGSERGESAGGAYGFESYGCKGIGVALASGRPQPVDMCAAELCKTSRTPPRSRPPGPPSCRPSQRSAAKPRLPADVTLRVLDQVLSPSFACGLTWALPCFSCTQAPSPASNPPLLAIRIQTPPVRRLQAVCPPRSAALPASSAVTSGKVIHAQCALS